MALIKIINGTYGVRINAYTVDRKTSKSDPFTVSDSEARRLVECGVAKIVEPEKPEPAKAPEEEKTVPEYNDGMKLTELKELATGLGLDVSGLKTKAAVIAELDVLFGK